GMWTENFTDGTGEITGVMAAENIRIAAQAVKALADTVCAHDGRNRNQRNSDAMFALLTGTVFDCQCQREDCDAEIPDPAEVVRSVSTEVVVHVVTDAATLAGAPGIGWVDGHGIVSDEHVRDLAERVDATITPVTPVRTPPARVVVEDVPSKDVVIVYPGAQAADPYRPTAACADFVRVRDGYCTEPGCGCSAFDSDLDHVTEYDHTDPAQGGATASENLNAKCRFGHLHKTFGDWVDVQYRDDDGHLVTEYRTPEGVVIPGDAENLEDSFPNLRRIRYEQPPQAPPSPRVITGDDTPPTSNRLAHKHARRRAERARNQRERERRQHMDGPPPF
ncbi:HNH endonuclease signature motif containing protein, partial [Gordonia alkanivorans]